MLSDMSHFCITPFDLRVEINDSCARRKCHFTKLPINNPARFSRPASFIIFSDVRHQNKSQIHIKIAVNHGTDVFCISIESTFQGNRFISQHELPSLYVVGCDSYYLSQEQRPAPFIFFCSFLNHFRGRDLTRDRL